MSLERCPDCRVPMVREQCPRCVRDARVLLVIFIGSLIVVALVGIFGR